MQKREFKAAQRERLSQSETGRVLLGLLDHYKTQAEIARISGTGKKAVARWFKTGFITRRGAIALAEATSRRKEDFRPDLSAEDWEAAICGRVPNNSSLADRTVEAVRSRNPDIRLLIAIAEKFGSVRAAGESLGFSVADYHQWKSRGRIPAIKLPTLLAAQ